MPRPPLDYAPDPFAELAALRERQAEAERQSLYLAVAGMVGAVAFLTLGAVLLMGVVS